MKSKIDSVYVRHDNLRLCQGDILKDFEYEFWASVINSKIMIQKIKIPYLIILTQDCDLEKDFQNHENTNKNQDKFLHSILVCPAYPAEMVKEGKHLKTLNLTMEKFDSNRWRNVKNNQNFRYHFLKSNLSFQIPDLIVDFKHYYTIPRNVIYEKMKQHYIGTINELFRELLSQRFAFYLSRIGVPTINDSLTES